MHERARDTLRRRIVIYLLSVYYVLSLESNGDVRGRSANLPIDRRKKGRNQATGRGICGNLENSIWKLGYMRDSRPCERVEGLKAARIGLKRPVSRACCMRGGWMYNGRF